MRRGYPVWSVTQRPPWVASLRSRGSVAFYWSWSTQFRKSIRSFSVAAQCERGLARPRRGGSDHRQARSIIEAPICEISGRAQLNFITSFYRASRMALVWVSPLTASRAFFYRYVKLFARSPFTLKLILVIVFFQFFRFLTFCIWYCFILRIETAWRGVKKWVFSPQKNFPLITWSLSEAWVGEDWGEPSWSLNEILCCAVETFKAKVSLVFSCVGEPRLLSWHLCQLTWSIV